jgi:chromosome segregation ATPase
LVLLEKEKEELNSLLATALEEKQKVAQIVQEEFVSKQKELEEEVEFLKGKVDTNLEAFNMQEQELKELSSMREKFDLLERERSGWEKKAEITEKKYRDLKGKLQAAHDKKVKQKLRMQSANKENVAFN